MTPIDRDMKDRADVRHRIAIVLIVAIAAFMQMLDSSVLAVAIPAMAQGFDVSPAEVGIGITVYLMGAAIMIPAAGWFCDRFGAKRVFIVALLLFTGSSILCGLSATLNQFVAARLVQGLTGAMLGPVGSVILMAIIPRHDLLRMMNLFSAPMLIAPVIGPPLGGFVTTWFGWPWIFYLNLPIGVLGASLAAWRITELPRQHRAFDVRGFLLNGTAFAALVYGFDHMAGKTWPFGISCGLVLAGLVVGWCAIRHAGRPDALLRLTAVRYPTFRLVTVYALPFMRLPTAALPFVLPILLQLGFGFSAFQSGLLFLGHTGGDLLMKAFVTRIFRRFGYRDVLQVSIAGTGLSVAACALFTMTTPFWLMMLILFVGGCCRSFMMSASGTLSYAQVPPDEMTSATTLNQVVMQVAQALAVSIIVLMIEASSAWRGAGVVTAGDCRIVLVSVAVLTMMAIVPARRLTHDAGAEMSGHRPDNPSEAMPE